MVTNIVIAPAFLVLPCLAFTSLVLSCLVLSCLVLFCLVLPPYLTFQKLLRTIIEKIYFVVNSLLITKCFIFIFHYISQFLGGVKTKERFVSPLPLKIRHIPRIGYVSLFPFLLNVIPLGSEKLESILDIIESPNLLWSNHGLRSIAEVLNVSCVFFFLHVSLSLRDDFSSCFIWSSSSFLSKIRFTNQYFILYALLT